MSVVGGTFPSGTSTHLFPCVFFTVHYWGIRVLLPLVWLVSAIGGSVFTRFVFHPGFHFGVLGVERDDAEKCCITWCVYFHATRIDAGFQSFYYFLYSLISTILLRHVYHYYCVYHHVHIIALHALFQIHLLPQCVL